MHRWRARFYLVVLAAVCIAAGIVSMFVSLSHARDVFAAVAVLGGVAMLVVASSNGHGDG